MNRISEKAARWAPFGCVYNAIRFRDERKLIRGRHRAKSSRPSILHFSVNRGATQYVKSILSRCARQNDLVHVRLTDYAFNSSFPYLDHLSELEMDKYRHVFLPVGYLYSVFGGMVEGISDLDAYRVVLMVRDPRDVLTSEYFSIAYSHRPPLGKNKASSFGDRRELARQIGIDEYAVAQCARLRRVYERYADRLLGRPNVAMLTYEQMMSDFEAWLDRLLDHCGLTTTPRLRRALVDEARRSRPKTEDVFRHRRQALPGDHRRKLRAETIGRLEASFSRVLEAFGYASSPVRDAG